MKVVYTDAHLGHNPQEEIAESGSHSPHEHTARAENIREVLQSDATMQFLAPTQWGVDPINAVHNPGLNNFLTNAWADYQREVRPSREVVPDFFYRPSMREAMSQLDEPTAALGVAQTEQVLNLVRRLADNGLAVVLISHNLNDVFEVADNIAALYLGNMAAQVNKNEVIPRQVIELITTGKSAGVEAPSANKGASK